MSELLLLVGCVGLLFVVALLAMGGRGIGGGDYEPPPPPEDRA